MDVVVYHADVLHERVHTGPHEAVSLWLQLLGERLRLRCRRGEVSKGPRRTLTCAATRATLKPWKALGNASRLPNTIDQLSPASNTPRVSASNNADSS